VSRVTRGGNLTNLNAFLASSFSFPQATTLESAAFGFRVAMVPEPTTGLLLMAGLLGLGSRRRGRR
jgi:hypothetical protein